MNFLQPAAARLPARATFRKSKRRVESVNSATLQILLGWTRALQSQFSRAISSFRPRVTTDAERESSRGCKVDVQPGAFVELERLTSTNTRQPERVHSLLSAPSPSASFYLRPHTNRIAPAYIHTFDGFAEPLRPASLLIASQLPTAFSGVHPDPVSHTLGHSLGAST